MFECSQAVRPRSFMSAVSNLAGGAQHFQRRLPGLYDSQDGLVIRQANPGGRQVLRDPNVAVYVLLRKTLCRALFLLLGIQNTNTVMHVMHGRLMTISWHICLICLPFVNACMWPCVCECVCPSAGWGCLRPLARPLTIWQPRQPLPGSGSGGVICATPRCPSPIPYLILSGNGIQKLIYSFTPPPPPPPRSSLIIASPSVASSFLPSVHFPSFTHAMTSVEFWESGLIHGVKAG